MRYLFDHDLHIHSKTSLCSNDPLQTSERILLYAKQNNLKTICLTNHFWDENVKSELTDFYKKQNFAHVIAEKPLPKADGIDFLFGCETELDKNLALGISKENFDKFDFIVIPTTHFHITDFAISESVKTPEQKARCWFERFNAVLDADLPFYKIGFAHLTCALMDSSRDNYLKILELLDEKSLRSVFTKAAKRGVGIELNSGDMSFSLAEADKVLRPYKIAKEEGCKFYLGSDAHHPFALDGAKAVFERAINMLDLEESDKFTIKKQ